MKDNFSTQSEQYAKYRPTYPPALFDYLKSIITNRENAWDCGTGNGQVAAELSIFFKQVYATDISQQQIDLAVQSHNIEYSLQPAEKTNFPNHFFDLVIVAQAIHWFDFEKFYAEVRRTSKPNAFIVVTGYGGLEVAPEIDQIKKEFYKNVVGPYWDKERKYIDENYTTIPFPFKEIQAPALVNKFEWDIDHLIGYINTWSAVKHFIKQNGYNPVDKIYSSIEQYWGKERIREVCFPLLLRIGLVQ